MKKRRKKKEKEVVFYLCVINIVFYIFIVGCKNIKINSGMYVSVFSLWARSDLSLLLEYGLL